MTLEAFGLQREKDVESWLKPYTAAVLLPGRGRTLTENSRLFFVLHASLVDCGLTEEQIADYAGIIAKEDGVAIELAMTEAVMTLAIDWGVKVPESDAFTRRR